MPMPMQHAPRARQVLVENPDGGLPVLAAHGKQDGFAMFRGEPNNRSVAGKVT